MSASDVCRLVEQFVAAKNHGADPEQLNLLAELIQQCNQRAYLGDTTFVSRRYKVTDSEMGKWKRLSAYVAPSSDTKLFDCAFGSGRDLLVGQQLGYDVYGCELSSDLYADFVASCKFSKDKLFHADFRSIPCPDKTFDVVRHNASFLHLPVICKGYTVHKCLQETCRILKDDGLVYVYTKEGSGFVTIDTGDGLGVRSFQLFDEQLLRQVLYECGFEVLQINHFTRERNGAPIQWIEAFAQKKADLC